MATPKRPASAEAADAVPAAPVPLRCPCGGTAFGCTYPVQFVQTGAVMTIEPVAPLDVASIIYWCLACDNRGTFADLHGRLQHG